MPGNKPLLRQFLGTEPVQRRVELDTVLLSIQAGTVYLASVQEDEMAEELMRSFQDEIDAGALTPVPRERSTLPD